MRKPFFRTATLLVVSGITVAFLTAASFAEGLTKEQGDAILKELRQIRALLERQQRTSTQQPPTAPEKVSLKLGNELALGLADAPVTVIEYSDYQCPYCNRFYTGAFPEIKSKYIETGKVRFIKRDLALDFHPYALKAAQAARCAGDQGKFWEMDDLLSANSTDLGPDPYMRYASKMGIDTGVFKACIEGEKHIPEIRESGQGAASVGIRGTPSFVVGTVEGDMLNGVKIIGAQPYPVFEKVIKEYLSPNPAKKAAN